MDDSISSQQKSEPETSEYLSIKFLLFTFSIICSWNLLWYLSRLLEYVPHASLWYPPAALSFALLLAYGIRAFPLVWACVFMSVVQTAMLLDEYSFADDVSFALAFLLFPFAHALPATAGACLIHFYSGRTWRLTEPNNTVLFLFAILITSLLAALSGTMAVNIILG